ncbi:MAG: hypothetical protein H0V86_02060 [Chloroflexia bacterium]|nr:hypothetical protein [Chloroflexia bacterium]
MTQYLKLAGRLYITLALVLGIALAGSGSALAQDGKTGAGDDQQMPDNQQTGGGKGTVTKTFELTLNGTVPEGDSFYVQYLEEGQTEDLTSNAVFCGELIEEEPEPACEEGGAVYTVEVEFDAGTTLDFRFGRHNEDYTAIEVFHEGAETLDVDMTNAAYYTYGTGTGAGDDQQDDTQDDSAGAGDDQQDDDKDSGTGAGDDQQEDTQDDGAAAGDDQQDQDDVQDDQQGEMPEEMPETGAGGLAVGGYAGGVAAALGLLVAATAPLLRRR